MQTVSTKYIQHGMHFAVVSARGRRTAAAATATPIHSEIALTTSISIKRLADTMDDIDRRTTHSGIAVDIEATTWHIYHAFVQITRVYS